MPARTRTSNQSADFKVYYSTKVPKQKVFPHRAKKVRVKPANKNVEAEYKQLTFQPEALRRRVVVEDSDEEAKEEEEEEGEEEEEEGEEEEEVVERAESNTSQTTERTANTMLMEKGKKRNSDVIANPVLDGVTAPETPAAKHRRMSTIKPENDVESTALSESDEEEKRFRRRTQSTMTQLVSGRKSRRGEKELEFKPVKRMGAGRSKGVQPKGKSDSQRTLTQMIPGLIPLSSGWEDEENGEEIPPYLAGSMTVQDYDDEESDTYNPALRRRLPQPGVFRPVEEDGEDIAAHSALHRRVPLGDADEGTRESQLVSHGIFLLSDVEDEEVNERHLAAHGIFPLEDDEDDEYQPTQIVHAPVKRKRTSRHPPPQENIKPTRTPHGKLAVRNPKKSRFSLLSTPQRRRVTEIASSQSPPNTPLSTQSFTENMSRSPLKERSNNTVQDTPSKRINVTFQTPAKISKLTTPSKRRFASGIVPDSDEEEEDVWSEHQDSFKSLAIGAETQAMVHGIDHLVQTRHVGAETQAILIQIDQACANAEEDAAWNTRDLSPELGNWSLGDRSGDAPRELERYYVPANMKAGTGPQSHLTSPVHVKKESMDEELLDLSNNGEDPKPSPGPHEAEPTKRLRLTQHNNVSTDLNGLLIQVPRSPSPAHPETQRSHSSKAEHQLQSEWQSYSQFRPQTSLPSSLHDALEAFGYQPTPFPAPMSRPGSIPSSTSMTNLSQATTVDGTQMVPNKRIVTPRKTMLHSQLIASDPTPTKTPSRASSSQPFVSPLRPLPLIIPSSFPSPGQAGMPDWSTPVLARDAFGTSNQWADSVDDFSIPPRPPLEDDDCDK
ncbi:uncharacterized protein BDR25DRAFT_55313 [Lindgomyces ingoldianus]|uniref:Uncharacterized protein n=1 Tax=Lindgomyces ingoldianus TaxID=673940 RepID=A0ACB6QNA1_9PLEO|nr:uncharacterized protein BDR25DRAFT_55313 [Lindgomyces ingoldianus]KAF2468494.1 hypothetical protein BDR25DRAFT_55313 [Lindgomyces ingoldianus]